MAAESLMASQPHTPQTRFDRHHLPDHTHGVCHTPRSVRHGQVRRTTEQLTCPSTQSPTPLRMVRDTWRHGTESGHAEAARTRRMITPVVVVYV